MYVKIWFGTGEDSNLVFKADVITTTLAGEPTVEEGEIAERAYSYYITKIKGSLTQQGESDFT